MESEITVIDARDMLKTNSVRLIDVRSSDQFEKKNIPGSINIPLSKVSQEIPKLETKKMTLLVCNDGSLSVQALKIFEACGFKAHVIRGGLFDWGQIIGF